MTTPATCPIAQCQVEIVQLSTTLIKQIRAAKRLVKNGPCARCETDPQECPILAGFDHAVNEAIQQLSDEWNLSEAV